MNGNKKSLHTHLFIVGVVAVVLILLITNLQAKNNFPSSVIAKKEGCIKSLERSCFQRTTPAGNILLDNKGGNTAYRKCFYNSKIPGTYDYDVFYDEVDTEYCSDFGDDYTEVFQYCIEGKDQYISEFFGYCRRKTLGGIGDRCRDAFECKPEYFCNLAALVCDDPDKYGYSSGGFGNSSACRSNGDCRSTEYCELPAGFCARFGCRTDNDCTAQGLTNYYCDTLNDWRCAPKTTS